MPVDRRQFLLSAAALAASARPAFPREAIAREAIDVIASRLAPLVSNR